MDGSDARDRRIPTVGVRRGSGTLQVTEQRNSTADDRCKIMLAQFLHARLVQQQERAQEVSGNDDVIHSQVVQFLPGDLLFKIFITLPAESLSRMQYVCKTWYSLINSSIFISSHAQQTKTVLVCLQSALSPELFHGKLEPYFHFLDYNNARDYFVKSRVTDKFRILASCDGLILAKLGESKSLLLTNPMTRKQVELPMGTIPSYPHESYNLSFCNEANTYKLVHLFYQSPLSIGCEILGKGTKTWKWVINFASQFLPDIWVKAISLSGSLYWMSQKRTSYYFLSMNVQKEKLMPQHLPSVSSVNDRLVEIGGALGLVTHATHSLMHVWTCDVSSYTWTKRYDIDLNFGFGHPVPVVPICSTRNGKDLIFVFPYGHHLYSYDSDKGEMKLVYSVDDAEIMNRSTLGISYVPHRNTLVSWDL